MECRRVTLWATLALDIAAALLLGTATDPARFVRDVWPHQRALFGETTLDLVALALLRVVVVVALLLATAGRAARVASSAAAASPPLLEPLQLNGTSEPVGDKGGWWRAAVTPVRCSGALLALTVGYSALKALFRMLQSGLGDGSSSGSLPPGGTAPSEAWFWLALAAGCVSSSGEHVLCRRLLRRAAAAGEGGAAARAGGKHKKSDDPAEAAKKVRCLLYFFL